MAFVRKLIRWFVESTINLIPIRSIREQWGKPRGVVPLLDIPKSQVLYYSPGSKLTLPNCARNLRRPGEFVVSSKFHTSPDYVLKIPNGRVCLRAVFDAQQRIISEATRDFGAESAHDHWTWTMIRKPKRVRLQESAAWVNFSGSENYFHWMFGVFHALSLLVSCKERPKKFLLKKIQKNYERETLAKLQIDDSEIIEGVHAHISAPELWVASFGSNFGSVSRSSINFLRENFLPVAKQVRGNWLYVSRKNARYRKLIDEDLLLEELRSRGFRIETELEAMSVSQQAELFAGAELVVGAHGAALANLAFCSKNTSVVEIYNPKYMNTLYTTVSYHLGLNHYAFIAESSSKGYLLDDPVRHDLLVDRAQFLTGLDRVLDTIESSRRSGLGNVAYNGGRR